MNTANTAMTASPANVTTAPDNAAPAVSPGPAVAHRIPAAIRILRSLRPMIAATLASRLHPLLSREVLLLEYRGRRSGSRYELPLSYVENGSAVYLCTRPEGSKWWRNLTGGADVRLRLRGHLVPARATVLDSSSGEALEGLRAFLTRNPRTGEMLYHVARGRDGQPDDSDLAREVLQSVVVRLSPMGAPGASQARATP